MSRDGRLLIRAPNHLGELVMALPALERAAELWREPPLVQLPARLEAVLGMSGAAAEVLPMAGRHRFVAAARAVRARSPGAGVLLTPSFSGALLMALGGVPRRRGTATDARGWLLTDAVDREPLLRGHRVREFLFLVEGARSGRREDDAREVPDGELPRPRLRRLSEARRSWRALADRIGGAAGGDDPAVGLVPGGRASSRRWPADRWRELAGRLLDRGLRVRVFGGPDEERLTRRVAAGRPGAVPLGGRTGLAALAGGLAACEAVAANDTGPMQMAAALGRPLAVVWGAGDPVQTRPLSPGSRLLGTLDLPCHPCLEQSCPRSGEGYRSGTAERECLRLVPVERVERAVLDLVAADGAGPGACAERPGAATEESGGGGRSAGAPRDDREGGR